MTILITGGAGFIGSTLTQRLLNEGHVVLVVDNFNNYYDPALKWQNVEAFRESPNFFLFEGDIRHQPFLQELFRNYAVDAVVHLAGLAGVRASLQNPTSYFDHNLTGTSVLLEAMRMAGIDRFVFASSSSVYGERRRDRGPFQESDRTDAPVSPYALSKRAAELLCYQHHHLYGLNVYCLRLFTVYGPRQRPDMAISRFIHQLFMEEKISLFGDGSSQRDYTYVDDIVAGIVRAAERVEGYELINLGSAAPISLRNLLSLLENITNQHALVEQLAAQPGDVPYTYASIDKARRLLDYSPRTDLREGLRQMVAHYETVYAHSSLTR